MCPRYEAAVGLLGKRWTGLILRLLLDGPRRFGALAEALQISERVLSSRLKELEGEGVLARTVFSGPPVRVEYRLTPKGLALGAVVEAIGAWAEAWVAPARRKRTR